MVATDALHEMSVKLADEPQGKRQLREAPDTVLQCHDIIGHLAEIRRTARDDNSGLCSQQLAQCGLRPFNPAGQHRLAPHEGPDEEMGVRQASALSCQPTDSPVRI
jgi:hypothetical protein